MSDNSEQDGTGASRCNVLCGEVSGILIIKNQLDALISHIYFGIKLYVFQTVPLSIIRSLALYTHQWYMSYRFC